VRDSTTNPLAGKLVASTYFAVAFWHDEPCRAKPLQDPGQIPTRRKHTKSHFLRYRGNFR